MAKLNLKGKATTEAKEVKGKDKDKTVEGSIKDIIAMFQAMTDRLQSIEDKIDTVLAEVETEGDDTLSDNVIELFNMVTDIHEAIEE